MKEKRNKGRYNAQFKTFNSEQSCIDVFSRIECLFLEKFFRYNLSDYFHEMLINVEQDLFLRKIKNKQIRQLSSETFLTKTPFKINDFTSKINQFYNAKNNSIQQNQLGYSFKFLYSNAALSQDYDVGEKQLVIVQVKMRAEIEKIQNLPTYFYKQLDMCQQQMSSLHLQQEQQFFNHLKKYSKNVLNLFVVYFGDVNFENFNKQHYKPVVINFFKNELTIKIFVFYVSRISLVQRFKKMNRIQNLEYINDLLIQLYEFKREKIRSKRLKTKTKNKDTGQKGNRIKTILKILKWVSIMSVTGVALGALYLKFFF